MKKFTTQTTVNGKTKTVFVYVDDETARMLNGLDEQSRREYILSEHEIYLNHLRETRRHCSLDESMEHGIEFMDSAPSPEEVLIRDDVFASLRKAVRSLKEEEKWLVTEVFYKKRPKADIARKLGISKQAIDSRLRNIFKKLKEILKF